MNDPQPSPPASSPPRLAFVFPGQGAQSVGMGRELAGAYPAAQQVFEQADDLLGFSLSRLAWEGPESELTDTINTQPALLVHSMAALRVFQEHYPEVQPRFAAGHSMGELSALAAAGALPFDAALRLARRRGELMKQAGEISPGGMAAILGLDFSTLDEICSQASTNEEVVQTANDNCPGQVVISGHPAAVARALALARQSGARRAVPLAVSIASHSPLMRHAQEGFSQAAAAAPISDPQVPVIGNVNASALLTAGQIREDLQAQLTSRVRWRESVLYMIQHGVSSFLEFGSGSVLTGLLKRIDANVKGLSLDRPPDFEKLPEWFNLS